MGQVPQRKTGTTVKNKGFLPPSSFPNALSSLGRKKKKSPVSPHHELRMAWGLNPRLGHDTEQTEATHVVVGLPSDLLLALPGSAEWWGADH